MLGVNRKNIYRKSRLTQKDKILAHEINKVHIKHPSYGYRRLAWHMGINHKRVLRVMKKFNIKPPRRKIKHWCTVSTNSHTYTNLIKDLTPTKTHQLWCSDTSFFKFQGRFWYLVSIEDIYTRQVLSAFMGRQHDSQLVLGTIKQAIKNFKSTPKIFHSDQGTEFMAKIVTNFLESFGVKISASDKASPWQNGYKESFFGRFKDEFGDINRFDTSGELMAEIYSQINYYNQKRIHTALKMPPAVFANQT